MSSNAGERLSRALVTGGDGAGGLSSSITLFTAAGFGGGDLITLGALEDARELARDTSEGAVSLELLYVEGIEGVGGSLGTAGAGGGDLSSAGGETGASTGLGAGGGDLSSTGGETDLGAGSGSGSET